MTESLDEQRHNLTHAMGECILAWSKVEQELSALFFDITGGDLHIQLSVFESIVSMDGRLAMIEAVLKAKSMSGRISPWASYLPHWEKMSKRIRKTYKKRNGVAHSDLVEVSLGNKVELRMLEFPTISRPVENSVALSVSDLTTRREIFGNLAGSLQELRKTVQQQQEIPPISNEQAPCKCQVADAD